MRKVLLCELNISEGIDSEKIGAITAALEDVSGLVVLDINSNSDHNRTVYTFMGAPEDVLEGAKRVTDAALARIDMTVHKGSHPRIGAVDVVPFVPIRNVSEEEALGIARAYGAFLGGRGVPVYYYEDAATKPERKVLVTIRKGQYEGFAEKMKDPAWIPDEGPAVFPPEWGATVTGVRFSLVAFNVNLRTEDLNVAKAIAKAVRFSSGGFHSVRAIALPLEESHQVQVSMNLVNYRMTPIPVVFETVKALAESYGVAVGGAELVGPVPLDALKDVVTHYLRVHDFNMEQIIEAKLID
ncbi:glutamate formimidoyltransferase [Aminiphilus sp.]|uniref:glutamate formimidoyltransferase n=1 Tax=Aminiphilus sp. TaxID=1872488 RepID=UPI00262AD013|nr:glutamate formimidoyltransferase [Aminiphilus sp.]